jgi:hypothetical protein
VVREPGQRGLLALGQVVTVLARADRHHVEVDADHPVGVVGAERRRDGRAPVPALGAEALVAEGGHQLRPGDRDALHVPAGAGRLVAEPVAGQRRADDMEGVRRVAAGRRRIAQRLDDAEELDDRARPAVGQHKR